jgi:hypothetical protein
MWIWIVAGVMGFVVLVMLIVLIAGLTRKRGYSLQRGGHPKKRKNYGSTYTLQRGSSPKRKRLSDRTGRLQRGARPKKRSQFDLDDSLAGGD